MDNITLEAGSALSDRPGGVDTPTPAIADDPSRRDERRAPLRITIAQPRPALRAAPSKTAPPPRTAPPSKSAPPPRTASWRALAHRDFRWFFTGNACSNLGTWFQNTAQMILAYHLTGSAAAVGAVTCAQFSSALLIGPWAGAIADRMDRRTLLIITQAVSALVSFAMAFLQWQGRLTETLLLVGALVIGVAFTFAFPALSAIVPSLVPEDDLDAAVAMSGVSLNIGRAVAPILTIGVVASVGFAAAFVINGLSFLILIVTLVAIRPEPVERRPTASVTDGFRIARRSLKIQVLLVMSALVISTTDPPVVLSPTLATKVFHVSASWSGCFLAAMGIGTVLAAFLPKRKPTARGAAISLAVLSGAVMAYAVSPVLAASIVFVGIAGGASLFAATSTQALLLRGTTRANAGGIMGVWTFAYVGSRPITSPIDGWLADTAGVQWAGALVAAPALIAALVIIAGLQIRARPRTRLRSGVLGEPHEAVVLS